MVTVVQEENPWAQAAGQFGQGLAGGYMHRADENAVRNAIEKLGPNAKPRDILNTLTGVKTYGKEAKQNAIQNYQKSFEREERNAETARKIIENEKRHAEEKGNALALIDNSELPDEKKKELKDSIEAGDVGFKGAKELTKPAKEGKKGIFESEVEKDEARRYNEAKNDLPKLEDNLANIEKLRKLAENLRGVSGTIKGYLGTESAKEFDTLAAVATQPILKIFNPTGPIAVAKANLVLSRFAPKSTELNTTIQGKLNTLELFAKQALDRAQKEVELGGKYKGRIPEEEMEKLNADTNTMLDVFSQADPNTSNVTGYYSTKDGRALKPMPIQQTLELARQGLITNVKPK